MATDYSLAEARAQFMELHLADQRGEQFVQTYPDAWSGISKVCPRTGQLGPCICVTKAVNIGITPAALALYHHDEAAAKRFVVTGVEPATLILPESMKSLLGVAAKGGFPDLLRWLLEADETAAYRTRELVNTADVHGQSVLHWACRNDYSTCVTLLLSNGADPAAVDEDGNNPLVCAMDNGGYESAKAILKSVQERGADQLAAYLRHTNHDNELAICHAALQEDDALVALLSEYGAGFAAQCRDHPACIRCIEDGSASASLTRASELRRQAETTTACDHCGTLGAKQRCGRCRRVSYCNAECQRAHWKTGGHKRNCMNLMYQGVDRT